MAYLERARTFLEKGDRIRAAVTIIEGLRKDPGNDEALDELIRVYVDELPGPGLERDLVEVLQLRDDAGTRLAFIEHALEGESGEAKASALSTLFSKSPRPRDRSKRAPVEPVEATPEPTPVDEATSGEPRDAFERSEPTLPMPTAEETLHDRPSPAPEEEPSFLSDPPDLGVDLGGQPEAWEDTGGGGKTDQWKPMAVGFAAVALLFLVFFVVWSASGPTAEDVVDRVPDESVIENDEAEEP